MTVIKKTSKEKLKYYGFNKIPAYMTAAALIITLLISVLILGACSSLVSSPDETIGLDEAAGESSFEDLPETSSEDSMILEEEPAAEVDYQNLETGAEMKGYVPSFLCTDKDNYIRIEITNTSEFLWRNKRPGIVRIGYHYYGQDVDFVDYDKTSRTELPNILNPGETVSVNVLINDIVNPGYYIIQIDPVIEGNDRPEDNFWFSSKDVKMIEGLCYFNSCIE